MFMFPLQNPVYKLCPRPLLAAGPGVGDRPGDGRGHAAAGRGGTPLRTPVTTEHRASREENTGGRWDDKMVPVTKCYRNVVNHESEV